MTRRYAQAVGFEDVFERDVAASPVDKLRHRENLLLPLLLNNQPL
jgi:hypothetical protein